MPAKEFNRVRLRISPHQDERDGVLKEESQDRARKQPNLYASSLIGFLGISLLLSRMLSLDPLVPGLLFADRVRSSADEAMAGRPGALVVVDINSRKILAAHRLDLATQLRVRPGTTLGV
jgi:hypothetical protein